MLNLLRSNPWLALGLLIAGLLLAGGASSLVPSCGHARQVRAATQSKAEHQQAVAAGQAAQTKFQLDSTHLAATAQLLRQRDSILAATAQLLRQRDSILAAQQHALLLRHRRPLPAWDDLPRAN